MNVRKLACTALTGSVLLVGGLAATTVQAAAAPAPMAPVAAPATVADNWEFVGYYYWESDCHTAGQGMVTRHEVSKYRCDDGTWIPGDDYELEVVWNR